MSKGKKNKRKIKRKIVKNSRNWNTQKKNTGKKAGKPKRKMSKSVIVCSIILFVILANSAYNDDTIEYGPVGFSLFILFLLFLSFGICAGVSRIFRNICSEEQVHNECRKVTATNGGKTSSDDRVKLLKKDTASSTFSVG